MPIHPKVPLAMSPTIAAPHVISFARQPVPTNDTQTLYNRWKDLDENRSRLDAAALSQVPDDRLKPPPMQRTPSRNSARSVTEGMDNMTINDHKLYGGIKKQRAKRHGPLSDAARAKASLLRKIGACDVCSKRRVSCVHIDWSNFEAGRRRFSPQTQHSPVLMTTSQSEPYKPRIQQDLLTGIGSSQPTLSYIHHGPELDIHDEPVADPAVLKNTSLPNFPQHDSSMRALILQPQVEEQHVPIGRQLNIRETVWECQSGSDADLAYETTSSISADPRCAERFESLSHLKSHYLTSHHQFRESDRPYLYKCLNCEFLNEISGTGCAMCPSPQPLELQYWGYIAQTPLALPRESIPIPNVSPPRYNCDGAFPSSSGSSSYLFSAGNTFGTSYYTYSATGYGQSLAGSQPCSFFGQPLNCVRSVQDLVVRIFGISIVVLFFLYAFGWFAYGLRCCISAAVVGLTTGHIIGVSLLCVAAGVMLTSICRYMVAHVALPAGLDDQRCFFIRDVLGLSNQQVQGAA